MQPTIRYAILADVVPSPKEGTIIKFVDELADNWSALAEALKKLVESLFGQGGVEIQFTDGDRLRGVRDGAALALETPRFLLKDSGGQLGLETGVMEGRVGVALCTSNLSSKAFSRLRPIKANPGSGASVPVDSLPDLARNCRRLNRELSNAVFEWLVTTAHNDSVDFDISRVGELEVSALGVRDRALSDCFSRLRNTEVSVDEVLEDYDTEQRLSMYYGHLAGKKRCRLGELNSGESELIWFSSPVSIEVQGGYLESREVLYLLTGQNGAYQALGLAYDDSVKGNLALESTNRVFKWLTNKM